MSADDVPYPFHFDSLKDTTKGIEDGNISDITLNLRNVRGRIPSIQTSRLRSMMLEAHNDPTKIMAHAPTYDDLSSRLVEEAGFPMVFLAGYAVSSSYGLPDAGYIAMAEMCDKIPIPMDVKRTVECFAAAGAAGRDMFILARTDALIHGWDEAMARALPDRQAMKACAEEADMPIFANVIEGGMTENLSVKELAELGYSSVAYPWSLFASHLKSIRETLKNLKRSMLVGAPPIILTYDEVCKGVGFNEYWDREEKYKFSS
ncbi:Pyruvate/Phosphoenolpyruvate kinase-like domain-containing protein [Aspergillus tetrazonus]